MWQVQKMPAGIPSGLTEEKKTTVVGLEPEYCVTSEEELAELLQNICGA